MARSFNEAVAEGLPAVLEHSVPSDMEFVSTATGTTRERQRCRWKLEIFNVDRNTYQKCVEAVQKIVLGREIK